MTASEVEDAWEEYDNVVFWFDYAWESLHGTAEELERAEKRLDEALATPEQRKLERIRGVMKNLDGFVCLHRDSIQRILDE